MYHALLQRKAAAEGRLAAVVLPKLLQSSLFKPPTPFLQVTASFVGVSFPQSQRKSAEMWQV